MRARGDVKGARWAGLRGSRWAVLPNESNKRSAAEVNAPPGSMGLGGRWCDELPAKTPATAEGVPWRGGDLLGDIDAGLRILEVAGEGLTLGIEGGRSSTLGGDGLAVLFGAALGVVEAAEGGHRRCRGRGGLDSGGDELGAEGVEACQVMGDDGRQVAGLGGCHGLGDGAVIGAAITGGESLDSALFGTVPDGPLGDAKGCRERSDGLPRVRVVGGGLVKDFRGDGHGWGSEVAGMARRRCHGRRGGGDVATGYTSGKKGGQGHGKGGVRASAPRLSPSRMGNPWPSTLVVRSVRWVPSQPNGFRLRPWG